MNGTETQETQETLEPMTGTPSEVFGEEPETSSQETDGDQQNSEQKQPQQPTADQIRESVREGLREGLQTQQPQQRSMTQDELDAAFRVWKPNQEFVDQLLAGGEGALKAVLAMREGLSNQYGTLLQYSIEVAKRELMEQMNPAINFASEAAASRDREEFFKQNEDLRPYEKLATTVFNALKAEGYQAKTVAEAYKTLADRTRALLPQGNGNGAGAAQSGGARTTTPTQKRPAALSSGSQAGGGGNSAPAAPFAGAEIWGD